MKTKELKKIVEDNDGVFKNHVDDAEIYIYHKCENVGDINKNRVKEFNLYSCPKAIAHAIVDYANTPLEEREEEKKYRLRVPLDFNHYQYLNVDVNAKQYFVDDNEEFDGVKNSFTQKQIDEMPKSWQDFFIKEEVK